MPVTYLLLVVLLLTYEYRCYAEQKDASIGIDGEFHNGGSNRGYNGVYDIAMDIRVRERLETYTEDYGVRQKTSDFEDDSLEEETQIKQVFNKTMEMHRYMTLEVFKNKEKYSSEAIDKCKNREPFCAFWAATGECEKNPRYMLQSCSPACLACGKTSFEERCPIDTSTNIWRAGDLGKFFERITAEDGAYKKKYNLTIVSREPWLVTLDDFLSKEECIALIELATNKGYERSKFFSEEISGESGKIWYDESRTSSQTWCDGDCAWSPLVNQINQRIEYLTGIPEGNFEHLQMLKYDVGQMYAEHHDYIEFHLRSPIGPRMLTAYMYLNDVEAGGGTNFPQLNTTVFPKAGKLVVWPSVLDSDPNAKEYRTTHAALPVEAGVKYGANAWIHLREFKENHRAHCVRVGVD